MDPVSLGAEQLTLDQRTIVVSANAAWNLVNFRSGIIGAILERGDRVVAIAPPDEVAQAQLLAMGCIFEPIAIDSKGLSPAHDLRTLVAYWRLLRRHRPSHFLGWTIKPNVYGSIAARLCGVQSICNVSGLGTAFIRTNLLTAVVMRLYRVGLARAQTVFLQNTTDRDLFVDAGLVRPAAAKVLPGSGIDIQHFAPSDDAHPASAGTTFLLIARLLRDKGVVEYVEAARLLRARGIAARCQLLGPLGAANRTAIPREEVERWVDAGDVEYLGAVADVRLPIAAADCVVLPSYREGTSRVILEAAAMGKPVVASDVPGCREPVEHGRTGILCEARSATALADAMATIAAMSADERRAMGAAGRAKIVREYAERIVVDRYLAELDA